MALKRKIDSKMPETVKKSTKVEGSELKKKPLTKAELMVKFKALEEGNVKHLETITKLENSIEERTETNEKLIKENEKHLDTITKLESCIKLQRKELPDEQKQDELDMSEGPRYCDKCDYQAEDGYDLDAHSWSEHEEDASEIAGHTTKCKAKALECIFCDKKFQTLKT